MYKSKGTDHHYIWAQTWYFDTMLVVIILISLCNPSHSITTVWGRSTLGVSSYSNQGFHFNFSSYSREREQQSTHHVAIFYHKGTSLSMRSRIIKMVEVAQQHLIENRRPFVEDDDISWNPLSNAPCKGYTWYFQET